MCPFGEAMRKRFNFVADVVDEEAIQALENAGNDDITVSDLVDYAWACDLNLTIGFYEEKNATRSGAS